MNLQKARVLFGITVGGFLVLCNLGYLFAVSQGRQQVFSSQMDRSPIQMLSLLFFIGIIAFGLVRPSPGGDES